MNRMHFRNRSEFREWLSQHARSTDGIWLELEKTPPRGVLKAAEALEEALCFGWIDGRMERIDDQIYVKYFCQRRNSSSWSDRNRALAEKLEQNGLMTDFGREKIEQARRSGRWETARPEPVDEERLKAFVQLLEPFPEACANYLGMTPSVRRTYAASYFLGSKTDAGRAKRFETIVERLRLNLNPMERMGKGMD